MTKDEYQSEKLDVLKNLELAGRKQEFGPGAFHFVEEGVSGAAETAATRLGSTQGEFRTWLKMNRLDPDKVQGLSEYEFTGPASAPMTMNRPVVEAKYKELYSTLMRPLGLAGLDITATKNQLGELERLGGKLGYTVSNEDRMKILWGGYKATSLDEVAMKRSGLDPETYVETRRAVLDDLSLAARKLYFGPGAEHFVVEGLSDAAYYSTQTLKLTQGEFRQELRDAGIDPSKVYNLFQRTSAFVFTGDDSAPLQPAKR